MAVAAVRVLGVDLGGTSLRMALADTQGNISRLAEEVAVLGGGPRAVVAQIATLASNLLAGERVQLAGVGLATPGIVDAIRGVVVTARNLPGWQNVPVGAMLAEALGVPAAVENDVNAAALGEYASGAGRGHDSLVFVALGTGAGAGIIIDGRLHRGAHGGAGEIGSLPSGFAEPGAALLEDVASGPGILRRARLHGLAGDGLTPAGVFDAARAQHPAAVAAIADAAEALAVGLAALVAVVDPAIIVIGGGLSVQGETLLAPVRAALERRYPLRAPLVAPALGTAAQLHGAVALAMETVEMLRA